MGRRGGGEQEERIDKKGRGIDERSGVLLAVYLLLLERDPSYAPDAHSTIPVPDSINMARPNNGHWMRPTFPGSPDGDTRIIVADPKSMTERQKQTFRTGRAERN